MYHVLGDHCNKYDILKKKYVINYVRKAFIVGLLSVVTSSAILYKRKKITFLLNNGLNKRMTVSSHLQYFYMIHKNCTTSQPPENMNGHKLIK